MKKIILTGLAFTLCATGLSAAQFFTSGEQANFMGEISEDFHLENFSSLNTAGAVTSPFVTDGANGYGWTLTSGSPEMWSLGDGVLSTDSPNDVFVFTFTGRDVFAFGGDFWGSDYDGNELPASITLTTSTGQSSVQSATTLASFLGVISDEPLSWVSVAANTGGQAWPTTTNVITAIPEPMTSALLLGGAAIGICLWMGRKSGSKRPGRGNEVNND